MVEEEEPQPEGGEEGDENAEPVEKEPPVYISCLFSEEVLEVQGQRFYPKNSC